MQRGYTLCPHIGRSVVETPHKHDGSVGWSIASGSALTFAVLEKTVHVPALVSLLGMGAEPVPLMLS